MQTAFGKSYTDSVLYYAIKNIDEADWPISDTDFDVYLFDYGVSRGEFQEGSQHVKETDEILHNHGINVWTHQPKPSEAKQP